MENDFPSNPFREPNGPEGAEGARGTVHGGVLDWRGMVMIGRDGVCCFGQGRGLGFGKDGP
ncbi:hypothetical protein Pyn_34495 [Prunus yedoensis var. nudiflora]|uniref:Uncharacterized protein n=1 Tax=Prunus yedoensis var. nudiflora TaxID=2094558 RepID=A0A314ZSZ3_PRUYE|nr:hypothetical protein Pyn_34495 [Prunus yedoensis var. nudiflora]